MVRRLAIAGAILLCALAGLWAGALIFLPDAPRVVVAKQVASVPQVVPSPVAAATPPPPDGAAPLAMPIAGIPRAALTDSWGDPRENGLREHHGTDIMAPAMTPVFAAGPGTIEKLFQSAKGGTTIYQRTPHRLWTYYYAHLSGYAPGLHEGQVIRTGDLLGYVGDTGDAGPGNYHLHFGLTRTMPDQHWWQGADVDPFPYLAGRPDPR